MLLTSWLQKLVGNRAQRRAVKRRAVKKPRSRQDFVDLYLTKLEQRIVLNAAPLDTLDDPILAVQDLGGITIDAGDQADDGQADTFRVTRDGDETQLYVNDRLVYSNRLNNSSRLGGLPEVTVMGSGDDDTLIVDFSGGNPIGDGGLRFDGGDAITGDSMILTGGSADTVLYTFDDTGDGSVQIDGTFIAHSNVEPITDLLAADDRLFDFTGGSEQITLSDVAGSDSSQIETSLGASLIFSNPADSLTVTTGGDNDGSDTINLDGLDAQLDADVSILGDADDVISVGGDVDAGTGDVSITAESIYVDATLTTDAATVALIATDEITISSTGGIDNAQGQVYVDAGAQGTLLVGGTISVAGETAGTVHLLGDRAGLIDAALVDASGINGGGTVLVGGDYQGANAAVRNAAFAYLGPNAAILADSLGNGDGGTVILWADEATQFYGSISAVGGPLGGNGGFVETSGKAHLEVRGGRVNASAPLGANGLWLLDPRDVVITTSNTSGGAFGGGNPDIFTPTNDDANVDRDDIQAALNVGTSVTITTGVTGGQFGDITLTVDITKTAGGDATLTFNAARNIRMTTGDTIMSTTGALNVVFIAGGSVDIEADIRTNGGFFSSSGTTFNNDANDDIRTAGGDITLNHTGNVTAGELNASAIGTDGNVMVTGGGNITTRAGENITGFNVSLLADGDITLNSSLAAESTGTITVTADNDASGDGFINQTAGTITADTGAINFTAGANTTETISVRDITANGDITLTAGGNISIDDVTKNGGATATLLLDSGANINFDGGDISATNAALNVDFQAVGNVNIQRDITTNGGDFSSTGVNFSQDNSDPINTGMGGGNITITHSGTVIVGELSAGSGDVTVTLTTAGDDFTTRSGENIDGADIIIELAADALLDVNNTDITATGNLTLISDQIDLGGGANSVSAGANSTILIRAAENNTQLIIGSVTAEALEGNDVLGIGIDDLAALVLPASGTIEFGADLFRGETSFRGGLTRDLGATNLVVFAGDLNFRTATDAVITTGDATIDVTGDITEGTNAAPSDLDDITDLTADTISLFVTDGSTLTADKSTANGVTVTIANGETSTLSGQFTGAGGLTKAGLGTVIVTNVMNDYTGATAVNAGTLQLGNAGVITDSSAVTVSGTATFDLNDNDETIGSLAGASATANVMLGTATLTTGGNDSDTEFAGVISETGALVKAGTGAFTLSGANTYTGTTSVSNGTLVAANNSALGTAAAGTSVTGGATLNIGDGVTIASEAVTLNGAGVGSGGALTGTGTAVLDGNVVLNSNASIGAATLADTLTLGGVISGGNDLTKAGAGTVVLSSNNTYTGTTIIDAGTLGVTNSGALGTTGSGTTVNVTGTLSLNGVDLVAAEALTLADGTLTGTGDRTIGSVITLMQGTNSFINVVGTDTFEVMNPIVESAASAALNKIGIGTLRLNGVNTYTGTTNVGQGTLEGNTTVSGDVMVNNGGTLSPGDSSGTGIGTFTALGTVTFQSSAAILDVQLNGTTAGTAATDHDTLAYGGNLVLNNATLNQTIGFAPAAGNIIRFLDNVGAGAVMGQFDGLANGSIIDAGPPAGVILYTGLGGGDGGIQYDPGVAIMVSGANVGAADAFTIERQGEVIRVTGGAVVQFDFIGFGNDIIITGENDQDDTLTLTLSSGSTSDFLNDYQGTITFNAGTAGDLGSDALVINGTNTINSITYGFINDTAGNVDIDAAGTGTATDFTINYTGLDPISQNVTADNVTLNYSNASETITVSAAGTQTSVDSTLGEIVTFDNPNLSLTINAGDDTGADTGVDTINVNGFGTGGANEFRSSLTINAGDETGDTVNINANTTLGSAAVGNTGDLTVTSDIVSVTGAAINTTAATTNGGTGNVSLTAQRNIVMNPATSITTADGTISLLANSVGTNSGDFDAIVLNTATITTGSGGSAGGTITLTGSGGDTGSTNRGVRVIGAGAVQTIGTGAVAINITGTGGLNTGSSNVGVSLESGVGITSANGTITIMGTGGGLAASTGANRGVLITGGADVAAAGTGAVQITGIGGAGTSNNEGVRVFGAATIVTAAAGGVTVMGTGGGVAGGTINVGVLIDNNAIVSTSSTGTLQITGIGGLGTSSEGVMVGLLGNVQTTGSGDITITTDDIVINASGTVNAGANIVTVQNLSLNRAIDLGTETAGSLSLTDQELDRITAGTLRIGRNDALASGAITVTAAISPALTTALHLITGGSVDDAVAGSITETNLAIEAGGAITLSNIAIHNVAAFAANSTGSSVFFRDSNGFSVGTVDGVSGVTSGSTVTLVADAGDITVTNNVASSTTINLVAFGANAGINIGAGASLASSNGDHFYQADNLDINGTATINAGAQDVMLRQITAGTLINVGDAGANAADGTLRISDAELDRITASVIRIGNASSGAMTITSTVNPANSNTLSLQSGSTVDGGAAGVIQVANLAVRSGDTITLNNAANDWTTVAATTNNTASGVSLIDFAGGLQVGTVDGISGVTTGAGGVVILALGGLLDIAQGVTNTSSNDISLLGTGGINLSTASSDVSSATGNIMLDAETGTFTMAAGSSVVTGGNITVSADDVALDPAGTINAGASIVTVQNTTIGRMIDLGTETGGQLSLTDAEIDRITAGTLRIGRNDASASGTINISNTITPSGTSRLHLITGAGVDDGAAGAIQVSGLAVEAGGAVTLDNVTHDVDTIAINTTTGDINFRDSDGFSVGTVDGVSGIVTGSGSVALQADTGNITVTNTGLANDIAATTGINISALGVNAEFILAAGAIISDTTGDHVYTADNMDIQGSIAATGRNVTLRNATLNTAIDLSTTANAADGILRISDAELDRVTANAIRVGRNDAAAAGNITVSEVVDPLLTTILHLITGGNVMDVLLGAILETNVAVTAGTGVTLDGTANNATILAISSTAGDVLYRDTNGFSVGTVDGVTGVSTGGGSVTLNSSAGNITVLNTAAADDISATTAITVTAEAVDAAINISAGADLQSTGGTHTYTADNMDLAGTITASGQRVILQSMTNPIAIDLGSAGANAADATLRLSAAELAGITAGTLAIGTPITGAISITDTITLVTTNTLRITGGTMPIDDGATGAIQVTNLAVDTAGDVILDNAANDWTTVAVDATGGASTVTLFDSAGGLQVGTVDGIVGVANGTGPLSITANGGSLTVSQAILSAGGTITLDADGTNSDVILQNTVTTSGTGGVTITADDSVTFTAAADVTATGAGNVAVRANEDNAAGNTGNVLQMADGTVIDAGSGTLTLNTTGGGNGGDITLGRIVTTNNTNLTNDATTAVMISTDAGVFDAGDVGGVDIEALMPLAGVVIRAVGGVGEGFGTLPIPIVLANVPTLFGNAQGTNVINAIETSATNFDVENSAADNSASDIHISNSVATTVTISTMRNAFAGGNDDDNHITFIDADATSLALSSTTVATVTTGSAGGGGTTGGGILIFTDGSGVTNGTTTVRTFRGAGGTAESNFSLGGTTTLTAGMGNIVLRSGNEDVILEGTVIGGTHTAARDIIVRGMVTGANISLTADADGDGVGGVWIQNGPSHTPLNPALPPLVGVGMLTTAGDVLIEGSQVFNTVGVSNTPAVGGPLDVLELEQRFIPDAEAIDSVRTDVGTQITAGGTVTIQRSTNASATADVVLNGQITSTGTQTITANDDVRLQGQLTTTGAAADIVLNAGNDILVGGTITAQMADADVTLSADNLVGGIPTGDGVGGVLLATSGSVASGRDVTIMGSDLTTTAAVDSVQIESDGANNQVTAAGDITITHTTAAPSNADQIIDGRINSSGGGAVAITAQEDIRTGIDGDIIAPGGGSIVLTADDFAGTNGGQIVMADGSVIDGNAAAVGGTISLIADGDITLGQLTTNNNTAAAVSINSANGAVIDGGDTGGEDIIADATSALVTVVAHNGIGSGNAIETRIDTIDATNTTAGNIELAEANNINVMQLNNGTADDSNAATGTVNLATGNGSITVLGGGSGVAAIDGNITLDANGTNSDVAVNAAVSNTNLGAVNILADDSVTFIAAGGVTATGSGNTVVRANQNGMAGDGGNAITMADGSVIDSGSGTVELSSFGVLGGDITLGQLITTNNTASAVTVNTNTNVGGTRNVALFDNAAFVDTSNSSFAESDTLQASLAAGGHTVSTFTSTTAAGINAALAGNNVLQIPEQEINALTPALNAAARAAITGFVNSGGGLVIHGASFARASSFLNTLFGFGLADQFVSGNSNLTAQAAGTQFAGGPAAIPGNSATFGINTATLPTGSLSIYENGANTTVAVIPFGAGQIVFMGWDWFNAQPLGAVDGGWLQVLNSAVQTTPPAGNGAIIDAGDTGGADIIANFSSAFTNLNAGSGIGSGDAIETSIANLNAANRVNGSIEIAESDAIVLNSVTNADGFVTVSANGTLNARFVAANDTGANENHNVTLTTTTGGALLNNVTADNNLFGTADAGDVSVNIANASNLAMITATAGSIQQLGADTTADVTAATIDLNASTGIGSSGAVDVTGTVITADSSSGNVDLDSLAVTSVTAMSLTTGTGSVQFDQTGGQTLTVTDAATAAGNVTVTNRGNNLTLTNVVAGGSGDVMLLTSSIGNVLTNSVTASGDMVQVNSAGSIQEAGSDATADILAAIINLNAVTGIGSFGALDVTGALITADSNNGNLDLDSLATGTVTAMSLTTGIGSIQFDQTGAQALAVMNATTGSGNITVLNVANNAAFINVNAGGTGDVRLQTSGSGNVMIASIAAVGDFVQIQSAQAVADINGSTNNVSATSFAATAISGIGSGGNMLETNIANFSATGGTGGVYVVNSGSLNISNFGPIPSGTGVSATGADIVLMANGGNLAINAQVADMGGIGVSRFANGFPTAGNVTLGASGSVVVNDTGAANNQDVRTVGGGVIRVVAANVNFNGGRLTSGTGAVASSVPFINVTPGTAGFTVASELSNTGVATVSGAFGTAGDENMLISVYWNDVASTASHVLAETPGTFSIAHQYLAAPLLGQGAAPVPIFVTITRDPNIVFAGGFQQLLNDQQPEQSFLDLGTFATGTGDTIQEFVPVNPLRSPNDVVLTIFGRDSGIPNSFRVPIDENLVTFFQESLQARDFGPRQFFTITSTNGLGIPILANDIGSASAQSVTVLTFSTVPGTGISLGVVQEERGGTQFVPFIPPPPENVEIIVTPPTIQTEQIELTPVSRDTGEEREVKLIIFNPKGEQVAEVKLNEDVLDELTTFFQNLPDGKYQITIKDVGEPTEQTVIDVRIKDGKVSRTTTTQPIPDENNDQSALEIEDENQRISQVDDTWERWAAPKSEMFLLNASRPATNGQRTDRDDGTHRNPAVAPFKFNATDKPRSGVTQTASRLNHPLIGASLMLGSSLIQNSTHNRRKERIDQTMENLSQKSIPPKTQLNRFFQK